MSVILRESVQGAEMDEEGFFFEVGILLEIRQPFENLAITPITNAPLANLVFDVLPTAAPGPTRVDLKDDLTISDILNLVIVDGFNRTPALGLNNQRVPQLVVDSLPC